MKQPEHFEQCLYTAFGTMFAVWVLRCLPFFLFSFCLLAVPGLVTWLGIDFGELLELGHAGLLSLRWSMKQPERCERCL
jgi:hypothetical protein